MTELPLDRKSLEEQWKQGESFRFYHFYGHKPPESGVDASCLSQWFLHQFIVDGIAYKSAEHWMMAEKARLFQDDASLAQILECETPREAKKLGRQVSNFDTKTWGERCFDIVVAGNRAKFQDLPLREFLVSTAYAVEREADSATELDSSGSLSLAAEERETYQTQVAESTETYNNAREQAALPSMLVEAAPRDCIWGIGLGARNEKASDPTRWRGSNLLGFVLTQVREEIRQK